MKTFNRYLVEQKNTHMEHVEDLIFNEGVKGARKAIFFLRDLRDMLAGHSNKKLSTTVKWDGCVHADTVILTNMGEMTIKQIVERTDLHHGELLVMGKELDSPLQFDHFVPLFGGNSTESNKRWVELEFEDGATIKLTEDHEVHTTNRGWVKAGDLTEDDDVTEL
jgi:hypothetical protein